MMKSNSRSSFLKEIVLFQDEIAKKTHKELFSFDDSCYFILSDKIVASILSAAERNIATRLHLSVTWENLLKVALWTIDKPSIQNVLSLVEDAGIKGKTLKRYKKYDISNVFLQLYYQKRFDVLRSICNLAKAKAESKIDREKIRVSCHLVSAEECKIIASSL